MPTQSATPFSQARLPRGDEADLVPSDLARAFGDVDDLFVLKATSQADRDTRFGNVPAGTLVTCAALRTIWMKISTPPDAAAWKTVSERPDPVTSGVMTGSGDFVISSQWGQRIDGFANFSAAVTYQGTSDINVTSVGNISGDPVVAVLGSSWKPPVIWAGLFRTGGTSGSCDVDTDGNIRIRDAHSDSVIAANTALRFSFSYPAVN